MDTGSREENASGPSISIIFDCDGVLVDSEVISCRAHAETLTRHGYPITPEQVLKRFLGVSDREARHDVEAELGRRLPDDFEAQMKQAALRRSCATILAAIPHVDDAHRGDRACRNAWPRAGRRKKSVTASTAPGYTTGLRRIFFPPRRCKRGKPAPDLFLFAAEQMNVEPARCLVIEDSVPGVTGGRAAGMTVLGFHGGSHCPPGHAEMLRAAGAAMTFDDMRQLPDLVRTDRLKSPASSLDFRPFRLYLTP